MAHWNKGIGRFMGFATVIGVAGALLGGCSDTLKEENARLVLENSDLRIENEGLKGQLDACEESQIRDRAQLDRLTAELAEARAKPRVERTTFVNNAPSYTLAGDVLFASGKAELLSSAKGEIDRVIDRIRTNHPDARIRVEGHTDTDPIRKSKWASNEALSEARANSVREYMIQRGIPASRIETAGMGSSQPKSTKKASRRVEIVIIE